MAECSICGDEQRLPYTCSRCTLEFCSRHRLPEKHDCPSLSIPSADTKWFKEELSSRRRGRDTARSRRSPSFGYRREARSSSTKHESHGRPRTTRQERRANAGSGPDTLPDGSLLYSGDTDEALTISLTRREAMINRLRNLCYAPVRRLLLFVELPFLMKISKLLRWILLAGILLLIFGQFGILMVPGPPIVT